MKPPAKVMKLHLSEPLKLQKGGELSHLEVAYHSFGKVMEDGSNLILICHALTGDSYVTNEDEVDKEPGWWNFFVGPGKAIDTNRFHVICTNVLGGCYGTTGPTELHPDTGRPWLTDFPIVTVEDMVEVQYRVLRQLGYDKGYAVLGGSLGGMQVLEWMVRFPAFFTKAVPMATGAFLSPQGLAFDVIGRQCITSDRDWKEGAYSTEDVKSMVGMKLARMIGHITYITRQAMDQKFGRNLQSGMGEGLFTTPFSVESFLRYQGDKFAQRFDPNAYLYVTKAMDLYDMRAGFANLVESLARVSCQTLLLSYTSDWLFPPEGSAEIAFALKQCNKHVSYACLETDLGHDAFLLERDGAVQEQLVSAFLA